MQELLNAEEFEAVAGRKLDNLTFAEIAGSDRTAFDRITFRPRLMIDSRQMDLSTTLLGESLFTPIVTRSPLDAEAVPPGGRNWQWRAALPPPKP